MGSCSEDVDTGSLSLTLLGPYTTIPLYRSKPVDTHEFVTEFGAVSGAVEFGPDIGSDFNAEYTTLWKKL